MRGLKILLIILIILSLIIVMGVGYIWYRLVFSNPSYSLPAQQTVATTSTSKTSENGAGSTPGTSTIVPSEPFTVGVSDLPESQQKVLNTLGLDQASLTITPAMVECAVGALGEARVAEIKNGATPSLSEGLTLISCSKR